MSELKRENDDDPRLPPDKPNPTPTSEGHLTDNPVERLSWRDIESDDDQPPGPTDRDFKDLGSRPPPESWTKELGAPVEPPEEQNLTEVDEDADQKKRLRRTFFARADDVHDVVESVGDSIQDALPRQPPTGYPETRSPRPVYSAPPDKGIDGGDAATSLVLIGALLGEAVRSGVRHFRDRREEKGA